MIVFETVHPGTLFLDEVAMRVITAANVHLEETVFRTTFAYCE
ncbi:hypothetical protein sS8_5163 [Methylocaldum marinum]|uniref:Uncharacterized protein n=1 Tax=Methylocaldum marinum TaxID=1432792 RepID=A0A250KZM1_9GAMM|nr:hypothetical protein [Methylocaldum marinum]BBA37085.1 hypothetical protein sS8_5163 [Methylocaldum marinum]